MTKSKRATIKDFMEEIEKLQAISQEVDSLRKRIADLEKIINIEDEVYKHSKTTHEEVFNAFQKDDIEFENSWHEEFLGFFCSE